MYQLTPNRCATVMSKLVFIVNVFAQSLKRYNFIRALLLTVELIYILANGKGAPKHYLLVEDIQATWATVTSQTVGNTVCEPML